MQSQSQVVSELEKLQQLHASGFLTEAELAQAKAKLLGSTSAAPESLTVEEADAMLVRVDRAEKQAHQAESRARVAELRTQLLRLESAWEQESKQHLIRDKYGNTSEPSVENGIAGGVLAGIIGVVMLLLQQEGLIFPALLIFLAGGIFYGVNSTKGKALQAARERYNQERNRIYVEIQKADRGKS